jgi:predicted DNA-binding transcriptional regulator YafY
MSDLLVRHWTVLKMIPRAPRKIDTSTIVQRLAAEHAIKTTPRTIQRDLQKLNEVFPLECDHLGQHFGWSWLKTADLFDLPGMDPQTALTLKLASLFLPRVLPRSTVRFLDAHVKRADAVLKEKLGTLLHRAWASKVRVVPKGLALVPPKIRADVLEVVYDAVFEERCFEARYVPRREGVAKTRVIHPLALIYRDAGAYLACMVGDHDGIVTLALHRIEAAKSLEGKRRAPARFDVDEYVARGSAGYRYAEAPLALDALVEAPLALVLAETPLAVEQELEPAAEGRHRLRLRLPDNWDLRSWILAQGDAIEVVEPVSLREEIADFLESAATVYGRAKRRHPRVNARGYVVRSSSEG